MNLIILDTSVLVSDLRTGRYEHRIQSLAGIIRLSSVVLAELSRGASTRPEREFLVRLSRNRIVLTPTRISGSSLERSCAGCVAISD